MTCSLLEIVDILRKHFDYNEIQTYPRFDHPDPLRRRQYWHVLVQIIISQRTTLENELIGANILFNRFDNIQSIANASVTEIEKCLHSVGLYKHKAKAIKGIADYIIQNYNGNLDKLLDYEPETIRQELLKMPGVGTKTADCMLELGFGKMFLPIDVNVGRVSSRLGIVPASATQYEEIRACIETQIPKDIEIFRDVHTYLLALGKKVCKSRPKCMECPVSFCCHYYGEKNE